MAVYKGDTEDEVNATNAYNQALQTLAESSVPLGAGGDYAATIRKNWPVGQMQFARGGYADGGETDPMFDEDIEGALRLARQNPDYSPFAQTHISGVRGEPNTYSYPSGEVQRFRPMPTQASEADVRAYMNASGTNPMEFSPSTSGPQNQMPYGEQMRHVRDYVQPTAQGAKDAAALALSYGLGAPADVGNLVLQARDVLSGRPVDTSHPSMGSEAFRERAQRAGSLSQEPSTGSEVMGMLGGFFTDPAAAVSVLGKAGAVKLAMAAAPAKRSTELTNLRNMPIEDALAIARKEPHLIPSGPASERYYVGGPREVTSPEDLTNIRNRFDSNVADEPRGADWYDRFRAGMSEVTGNVPKHNDWMAAQHAQWSAGVSPEAELGFAIKENNASLAGMPVKAARPAQHEAHLRAIEANDPSLYQLGEKTGEYFERINPNQNQMPGVTGVNDFRHAREWGYTEPSGEAQRNALSSAQHNFIDYETALAVDRARKEMVGGRSDWTGEQLQAAPWVRQKANDILEQRPNIYNDFIKQGMSPDEAGKAAYERAIELANRTLADYIPKHTAYATHEAMIGADTGHLPQSVNATQAERDVFSMDPRSTWANAPGGRDAIYSGLQLGDTGVAGRVAPTRPMTGMYTPPSGITETNMGEVARPLVGIDTGDKGVKSLPAHDRALLDAGEHFRAYVDAQNAGAAHKPIFNSSPADSNSFFLPMDRAATKEELQAIQKASTQYGLPDVVDTGGGVTVTRFYPEPAQLGGKGYTGEIGPTLSGAPMEAYAQANAKKIAQDILSSAPSAEGISRAKVDSIYADFVDDWRKGVGSGAATNTLLSKLNVTPEIRNAFDQNPYVAQNALARLERDENWVQNWGATRKDIQNARRIIGDGPGWIGRLEEGLKNGALLPAVAGAVLIGSLPQGGRE